MRKMKKQWLMLTTFGDGPRGEFLSSLAGLVDTGIPVYDALREMEKVFRKSKDPRADILLDVMTRLQDGKTIAEAMRPWLASHENMVLGATSRGVELSTALRNAAHLTESRNRIIGAVTGSMAYPMVLLVIGAGMMVMFATQVIPTLAKLIPVEKWSGLGLFYHKLSLLVTHGGVVILMVGLALAAAAFSSLPRWQGKVRGWLDRALPPWNLYQVYQGAIMLITISIMMRSGIAMADVVKILWDNNPSVWFRSHLAVIRRKLEQGTGVRLAALDSPIFPADVRISIALFDRLSEPDKAMQILGVRAGESAEKTAKKIGVMTNAMVLLLVGALVGGVIPAIMSIIMEFYSQMTTTLRI